MDTNTTLSDLQAHVQQKVVARGLHEQTVQDELLLLCEEIGELAKAARKITGIRMATDSRKIEISDEIADVIWMTICVANRLGIDIGQALRDKETKNETREWR